LAEEVQRSLVLGTVRRMVLRKLEPGFSVVGKTRQRPLETAEIEIENDPRCMQLRPQLLIEEQHLVEPVPAHAEIEGPALWRELLAITVWKCLVRFDVESG